MNNEKTPKTETNREKAAKNMRAGYIGSKFNKITIIGIDEERTKAKGSCHVIGICDCGNSEQKSYSYYNLKSKKIKSCGCLKTKLKLNEYGDSWDGLSMIGLSNNKGGIPFSVDVEDYPKIRKFTWTADSQGYFFTRINGKMVYLHRMIFKPDADMTVDHINFNRGCNNRHNLRQLTKAENSAYRTTTNYIKPHKEINKWEAIIIVGNWDNDENHIISLGLFDSVVEAQKARFYECLMYTTRPNPVFNEDGSYFYVEISNIQSCRENVSWCGESVCV